MKSVYKIPQKSRVYPMKEKENPSRCLISLCQCWFSWCFSMKVFTPFFQRRKAWRNDRKTVSVEKSQKLMQSGSSFPDWSKRNRGNSRADDWCSETQPRISGRNHRRICCGRYWWGGIIQQYKKSCPDCPSRKNGTGKTKYFHRSVVCMTVGKSPHVIFGQEMLKPRDGSERWRGTDRSEKAHPAFKEKAWSFRRCDCGGCAVPECPVYQYFERMRFRNGNPSERWKKASVSGCGKHVSAGRGEKKELQEGKKSIEVWDLSGFEIDFTWTIS